VHRNCVTYVVLDRIVVWCVWPVIWLCIRFCKRVEECDK